MKKILLVLIVALVLTGCSGSIPEGFTEDSYKLSKKALSIMDDYNSGDLTKSEAKDQLEEIGDRLNDLMKKDESYIINGVSIYIRSFTWTLSSGSGNTYEDADKLRALIK